MAQPLHDMTAAEFARATRDCRATRLLQTGERSWYVVNGGALRTLRLPASLGVADTAKSEGVTDTRSKGIGSTLHTAGRRVTEIVLADKPAEHPRLTR